MEGTILTLTWKDKRKGKSRILQHGDQWEVTRVESSVFFSDRKGPWLCVKSLKTDDWRWIHQTDDPHFKIV